MTPNSSQSAQRPFWFLQPGNIPNQPADLYPHGSVSERNGQICQSPAQSWEKVRVRPKNVVNFQHAPDCPRTVRQRRRRTARAPPLYPPRTSSCGAGVSTVSCMCAEPTAGRLDPTLLAQRLGARVSKILGTNQVCCAMLPPASEKPKFKRG